MPSSCSSPGGQRNLCHCIHWESADRSRRWNAWVFAQVFTRIEPIFHDVSSEFLAVMFIPPETKREMITGLSDLTDDSCFGGQSHALRSIDDNSSLGHLTKIFLR